MHQSDNGGKKTSATANGASSGPGGQTSNAGEQKLANSDSDGVADDAVIKLALEHLNIDKRIVETGRVRVSRTTTSHVEKVDIPLSSHTVEVRRVPIGKPIQKMPQVRATRKEIIIPVVEEVLVVERRLVLVEEVRIRKKESVRRHVEDVTLRAQEATVERVAPQDSDAGSSHPVCSEGSSGTGGPSKPPKKKKRKGVDCDH